jgi:hypothetical protein
VRHEKTHLTPTLFNCAICPAVFIRKHLLEMHSKVHEIPLMMPDFNVDRILQQQAQQPVLMSENFISSYAEFKPHTPPPLDLSAIKNDQEGEMSNEPMDLSNEKLNTNNETVKLVDSDSDDLKIVENHNHDDEHSKTENVAISLLNDKQEESKPSLNTSNEMSFAMTSRLTDLDKLEPSKDLPIEILQN